MSANITINGQNSMCGTLEVQQTIPQQLRAWGFSDTAWQEFRERLLTALKPMDTAKKVYRGSFGVFALGFLASVIAMLVNSNCYECDSSVSFTVTAVVMALCVVATFGAFWFSSQVASKVVTAVHNVCAETSSRHPHLSFYLREDFNVAGYRRRNRVLRIYRIEVTGPSPQQANVVVNVQAAYPSSGGYAPNFGAAQAVPVPGAAVPVVPATVVGEPAKVPQGACVGTAVDGIAASLAQLEDLKARGLVSSDEYATKRAEILSRV